MNSSVETLNSNPLLTNDIQSFNVDFKVLTPEFFNDAYEQLLLKTQQEFDAVLKIKSPSFKDLFHSPYYDKLGDVHGLLCNLNGLVENEELRKVEEKYSAILSEKSIQWSLNKKRFNLLVSFSQTPEFSELSDSRKKMILKIIQDLKDNGIDLSTEKKKELTRLNKKLSKLVQKFQNNITDAQDDLHFGVKENQLRGLSERALKNVHALSKEHNMPEGLYLINEVSGLLDDVMSYTTNSNLKKKIYLKRRDLCKKGKYKNTEIIDSIYKLEQDIAHLLGYANYSEMALKDNMAKHPTNILAFLQKLGETAMPHAKKESELIGAKGREILKRDAYWWDNEYVINEMIKETLIDSEVLRQYFPVEHVVNQLFEFCKNKFNLAFKHNQERFVWQEDVKFYDVYEGDELIGGIFMDLYKRPGKMPGAWLSPVCTYENNDLAQVKPIALLVCNAVKDIGQVSTFTLEDVVTLFHEMGHGLHHLLSKVDEGFYSGFNNVQQDVIELPSQLFENFVYTSEILKSISSHTQTGESLSDEMIEKIKQSKKFLGAGVIISMVRFAEMDINLYLQNEAHPYDMELQSMKKWQLSANPDFEYKRMPRFSHLFGGGYASEYYSYQWAEVLAADGIHYLTEVQGSEQQQRFDSYKKNILYTGGFKSMEENYLAFRGQAADSRYLIESYL